ncbi:hypothetical protein KW797_04555 [Candidatus Parcubacteria bacterium]|nr:hypothetical protein [Candidatus Parcubacteria bacterium]
MSILNTTRLLLLSLLFAVAASAVAQEADIVTANITPPFPKPSERVVISLVSYATDLDRATIAWTVDGKNALSGTGETELALTMGKAGETKRVQALITPPGLPALVKEVFLTPGDVDIIVEAVDAYTPPFYRGKALPSSEAQMRAVAIPNMQNNGSRLKSENLVYQWRHNGAADAKNSGFGRNAYLFKGGFEGTSDKVEVTASTVNGEIAAQGNRAVNIGAPLVAFYENRPLEGVHYEEALPSKFSLLNDELSITAVPYFFSAANKNSLTYVWLMNGRESAPTPGDRSALVVRAPKGTSGTAEVVLEARHEKKLLQSTQGSFSIKFAQ